ncbi:protein chibby homolog 1 [Culicoides brevitarsis]|uniref:protein chibby homolog 1 n=1 Tax=Culicoides brevitarsis TaxID=469753 RepID=UPI00307B77B6
MPLFSKKSEKISTLPQRKLRLSHVPFLNEEIDDFKKVSLNLGNKEFKFIEGSWIAVTKGTSSIDDVTKLKHKITHLEEENNLNKIKVEVLLDMLAENMSTVTTNSEKSKKIIKN